MKQVYELLFMEPLATKLYNGSRMSFIKLQCLMINVLIKKK